MVSQECKTKLWARFSWIHVQGRRHFPVAHTMYQCCFPITFDTSTWACVMKRFDTRRARVFEIVLFEWVEKSHAWPHTVPYCPASPPNGACCGQVMTHVKRTFLHFATLFWKSKMLMHQTYYCAITPSSGAQGVGILEKLKSGGPGCCPQGSMGMPKCFQNFKRCAFKKSYL